MFRPFIVGHRGAAGLEPENTLRSVRRAIGLGVDAVEVDVRRSKDGNLVIMHDATVDRTTNGKGRVDSFTLSELGALDAGRGEKVPTLQEILGALGDKAGLFVEIKEVEAVPDIVDTIKRAGTVQRTTFVSFFHSCLGRVKELSPSSRCGVIFSGEPADPASLALNVGAELIVSNHAYVSGLMVEEAHKNSILVQTWTVNNPTDLARVAKLGVDGVATDYPDLIIESLRGLVTE